MGYTSQIEREYEKRFGVSMDIDRELEEPFFLNSPDGTCPDEFILDLYIFGDVTPAVYNKVVNHLVQCETCMALARKKEQAF